MLGDDIFQISWQFGFGMLIFEMLFIRFRIGHLGLSHLEIKKKKNLGSNVGENKVHKTHFANGTTDH